MTSASRPPQTGAKPAALPLSQLPRTLLGRRWWWTTLLVVLGMVVLARLGFWQLDRLEQRQARNAELTRQLAQPPIELAGAALPAGPAAWRDRPAVARGRYDFSLQVLLVEQRWQGAPGVHLITPLLLEGSQAAVLVDRGWIPLSEAGDLAQFDEPGLVTVSGYLQLSQTLPGGRQIIPDGPKQEWFRVDIEGLQGQISYELLPVYLLQSPVAGAATTLPYRAELDVDLSNGPHLSYAVQWFIFMTLLAVGYARYVALHDSRS
ncbi:MAG: SURF1 family protein [Chloroflexi bacterium]|nr:SURF1 family protein [Chloroflexota bacterium]MCI0649305.1 SURF1 family protein [Chloroflexota bacterium]MCI0725962.1 SURF1 family protein [Chloroflexota bacterium]